VEFLVSICAARVRVRLATPFVAILVALFAVGRPEPACAQSPAAPPAATPSSAPTAPPLREVTDETGRTIQIPQSIHRIVSLAPSLTETLYALGLQDLLVGDTDYCDFPTEAQHKPKVGGAINPSIETIASLHPDLVLVTKNLNRADTVRSLAEIGIPSYATDPHTVAEILTSTHHLAEILGAPESGATIARDLEQRIAETERRVASFPPRRVLFVVWPQPLISIGKNTFIADALRRAGAVSITDALQDWPQVSLEDVVHRQPDFLIFAESHSNEAPADLESLASLPGWRLLDAVKSHHYVLVSDAINRPAPRIVSVIEDLAQQLHPEAFGEAPEGGRDKASPERAVPALPATPAPTTFLRSPSFLVLAAATISIPSWSPVREGA
jgi:iron complex transport system substrate-binding protein